MSTVKDGRSLDHIKTALLRRKLKKFFPKLQLSWFDSLHFVVI